MYNEKLFSDGLPKSAFGKHYNVEFRGAHRDPITDRQSIITLNSKLIAECHDMFMFMSECGGIDLIYKERILSMICTEKPKHESYCYKDILNRYTRKST